MPRVTCSKCTGLVDAPEGRSSIFCVHCGSSISLQPSEAIESQSSVANLLLLGRSAAAAGNHKEAEDLFLRVLEVQPDDAEAWAGKGLAAGWQSTLSRCRFAEATQGLKRAIELTPEDARAVLSKKAAGDLVSLGVAYHSLALKHLTEFVALPRTWSEHLERMTAVIQLLIEAQRLDPAAAPIHEAIVDICKFHIEGLIYTNHARVRCLHSVSGEFEKWLTDTMNRSATRLRHLVPGYSPPVIKKAKLGWF